MREQRQQGCIVHVVGDIMLHEALTKRRRSAEEAPTKRRRSAEEAPTKRRRSADEAPTKRRHFKTSTLPIGLKKSKRALSVII
jgi:hypothetical protein